MWHRIRLRSRARARERSQDPPGQASGSQRLFISADACKDLLPTCLAAPLRYAQHVGPPSWLGAPPGVSPSNLTRYLNSSCDRNEPPRVQRQAVPPRLPGPVATQTDSASGPPPPPRRPGRNRCPPWPPCRGGNDPGGRQRPPEPPSAACQRLTRQPRRPLPWPADPTPTPRPLSCPQTPL